MRAERGDSNAYTPPPKREIAIERSSMLRAQAHTGITALPDLLRFTGMLRQGSWWTTISEA